MATSVAANLPSADEARPQSWLLSRAGMRLCALPLDSVVETMRLLPIEPVERSAPFILGLCVLRGGPVPVIDLARLFGERTGRPQRLVAIRVADRLVALAVDEVLGLRSIPSGALPPLLREAAGDVVSAIATLDAELLLFLDTTRVVSEDVLDSLGAAGDRQ
jgi:purine-binding chemotaxis protein CheW